MWVRVSPNGGGVILGAEIVVGLGHGLRDNILVGHGFWVKKGFKEI